jgi:hypothetical protein
VRFSEYLGVLEQVLRKAASSSKKDNGSVRDVLQPR